MEIERKFKVKALPEGWKQAPRDRLVQAYLCREPVVRVRQKNDEYWLTCKGKGLLSREEFELPLDEKAYLQLSAKAEGRVIEKDRCRLPLGPYTVELDLFHGDLAPLMLAEVEFPTEEEALAFQPPEWFGPEVTYDPAYTNARLSEGGLPHD